MNYAIESIPQNTTYVQGRSTFTILQNFKIDKETLENLVKILYDSEIDNGLFGQRYSIINVSCSGTIYGNFFYFPYSTIENLTTFLLNLYASLYSSDFRKDGSEYMTEKIRELASDIGGSISKPFEIIKNIDERKLYTTDFIKLIFNLKNESQIRDDMRDVNRLMIEEKAASLINPFESFESIDRILRMRLHFSSEEAAANELDTGRDELYELIRDSRNTGEEDLHITGQRLRDAERMRPQGPTLRPRRNPINYREARNYNRKRGSGIEARKYSKFLNVYARDARRSQIINGRADAHSSKIFDKLHDNIKRAINDHRRNL